MEDTYIEQQPIPGYRLESRLGSGGQASVYKAIQISMNRPVAIKVIRPGTEAGSVEISRFMREAQVLAKLRQENVVQAIDFGEANGVRYFVMEFLEGETVADIQKRQPFLEVGYAVDIASQVCRALDHAFKWNVIHRDIKPANIVIVSGERAVLVDFGLARPEQSDMQVTMAGMTVGTPHYMAPEQIRGEVNLDTRVDIYALGGTLFHMLTGSPPFPLSQKTQILIAHLRDPLLLPEKLPQEVPQDVFGIVKKAMRKEREKRYQKPSEMLQDLDQVLDRMGRRFARRSAQQAVQVLAPVAAPASAAITPAAFQELTAERDRLLRERQELIAKAEEIQKKAREMLQQKSRELEDAVRHASDLERRFREAETAATFARQRAAELEDRLTKALAERNALRDRPAQEEEVSDAVAVEEEPEAEVVEVQGEPAGEDDDDLQATEIIDYRPTRAPALPEVVEDIPEATPEPEPESIIAIEPEPAAKPAAAGKRREAPMIRVAKGVFISGENGTRDADPRQEATLPAFWIDEHPVTNEDYAEFVLATKRAPPDHWKGDGPPAGILDHPVVWVSWLDATEYSAWRGVRLPSRLEWQKAARGPDGRAYPWGNIADSSRCNCKESGIGATTPVGRYRNGASPYGVLDAAGNVAEWVAGEFQMPGADQRQKVRAVCGGSWRDPLERSRCASRRGYPDGGKAPYVGFRCARDH